MQRRALLILGSSAITACFASARWSALAQAPNPNSVDSIVEALTPRRRRGGTGAVDPAGQAAYEIVERLKDARRTRGLSLKEHDELYAATAQMPQRDFEIYFDFNSANITGDASGILKTLGQALSVEALKSSRIVIGGHTDRKGGAEFNQSLSERRAESVARVLSEQHGISRTRLVIVGYGFRNLKMPAQPLAAAKSTCPDRQCVSLRANTPAAHFIPVALRLRADIGVRHQHL